MNTRRWISVGVATAALALAFPAMAQTGGQQASAAFEKQITKTLSAKNLLYLPKEYGKDANAKWPLMLFLHGSGESGADLAKDKVHGPPKPIAAGKDYPFIVVSPQSPGGGWNTEVLGALLDDIEAHYAVDKDREYVTGLSMGGYGTWDLAMAYPNRFASIAPIAGGGVPWRVGRIRHVPAWVFHGAKDMTVPLRAGQEMADALKVGGEVKFTVYPEAGHDSWTEIYNNQELYDWLLQHQRAAPTETKP